MTPLAPKIRVMLVDDSAMIRGMMAQALLKNPLVEIVASSMNGKTALNAIQHVKVDVILLDVEMPEMDGITALPLLLQASPHSKIIMVSNLTQKNADFTMKALQLGAADCIAKPSARGDGKSVSQLFFHDLIEKVVTLGQQAQARQLKLPAVQKENLTAIKTKMNSGMAAQALFVSSAEVKCIAIGSSTGGPQALIQIFRQLPKNSLRVPIFITQHMPATFTQILAQHIRSASTLPCEEAFDGQEVKTGHIYIAPGDYHLVPRNEGGVVKNYLSQEPPVNFCRPAVNPMLESLAQIYGSHLLVIILTGMGQDGLEGAKVVAAKGGQIIVQDETSSVVWGMPGAIAKAGLAKSVLPLKEIPAVIMRVLV